MKERGKASMQQTIFINNFANVDIQTVNKDELVDVSSLTFDHRIPRDYRPEYLLKTVKNPYCFRVGDMGVKVEFLDSAPSLQDCLTDLIERKRNGL